ncbi:hypothetical protein MaudCBS49596_003412 [Microsporum audouinii]
MPGKTRGQPPNSLIHAPPRGMARMAGVAGAAKRESALSAVAADWSVLVDDRVFRKISLILKSSSFLSAEWMVHVPTPGMQVAASILHILLALDWQTHTKILAE